MRSGRTCGNASLNFECILPFTVGGTVYGLRNGATLEISDPGQSLLTIVRNGLFANIGQVTGANVTNIVVICADKT